MTNILLSLFIFCCILFLYLHIYFHLKTGEELEMYEVERPSKDRLEEICDLRQPVLFDMDPAEFTPDALARISRATNNSAWNAFDVKIRHTAIRKDKDAVAAAAATSFVEEELFLPLSLHNAQQLFREDTRSEYYSENNKEFLEDTGLQSQFKHKDRFLRPYMVSNCNYDVLMGSDGAYTPFRYEINYRNYFMVTHGAVQIKLAPPHCKKYLNPEYDYEHFEFRSSVNPWKPHSKLQCLEFTLLPGKTWFLPAYWWYSIKFLGHDSCVASLHYRTYMNNVAITPYIVLHAMQLQNIKHKVLKKACVVTTESQPMVLPDSTAHPQTTTTTSTTETNVDTGTPLTIQQEEEEDIAITIPLLPPLPTDLGEK